MEKQIKSVAMAFIAGLLSVILSAGIAWAGPSFDPHTAEGGLPQCKADLATCMTTINQTQTNYEACLDDLKDCTESLSTCEANINSLSNPHVIQVPGTGQTETYGPRDDGALEIGVMWSSPRFVDNHNGTVKDNFTGLVWTQNANLFSQLNWSNALVSCNGLANGSPGLSDGSNIGDWRLPNVKELQSLINYGSINPALPDHPFTDVKPYYYWSSTTYAEISSYGWFVSFYNGSTLKDAKNIPLYVWCVRNDESSDP